MRWSISRATMFSQCQRKWYYSEIVASPKSKNPIRREAYLLKQLQSLYAWRGKIVDKIIDKLVIPEIIKSGNIPPIDELLDSALDLANKQLEFGIAKRHRLPNITKSNEGDSYCAFYDLEYNRGLDNTKLDQAKQDITIALINLVSSSLLRDIIAKSSFIASQRQLMFKFDNTLIICIPDLIALTEDSAPLIIDWKVQSFANIDHLLQLGTYAIAMTRITPHRDFPQSLSQLKDTKNIRLIEFQLLKNKEREYSLSTGDAIDIDDYIFSTINCMNRIVNGKKFNELDANVFQTARSPRTCERCQFKSLCWMKTPTQTKLFEAI